MNKDRLIIRREIATAILSSMMGNSTLIGYSELNSEEDNFDRTREMAKHAVRSADFLMEVLKNQ